MTNLFFGNFFNIGSNLLTSSLCVNGSEPGLVLSAPISIILAPFFTISLIFFSASELLKLFPPSLKESGVTLHIPITVGLDSLKL